MLDCDGEELTPKDNGPSSMAKDSLSPRSFLQCGDNATSSISITMVLLHEGQVRTSSATPKRTILVMKNKMCNTKTGFLTLHCERSSCAWHVWC
jgi:hypothetical protein